MREKTIGTRALTEDFLRLQWSALGGDPKWIAEVRFRGGRVLPAPFAVSPLGSAAFASAAAAVAELVSGNGAPADVEVDCELASAWLKSWGMPVGGWERGTPWHDVSTDYQASDGRWVRLQANYPHLRRATARALGVDVDRGQIAAVIAQAPADEVERTIVEGGGAAAASRRLTEWAEHRQGKAVAAEPLIDVTAGDPADDPWRPTAERPLAGIRVLDVTRVLAGPMGTRFLAGYGAEVLRIDLPGYQEPDGRSGGDLTLGKRCAYLDLRAEQGRDTFLELLGGADVFVHGLRPGALDGLGLGAAARQAVRPGLVEVTLNAYGWSGPWSTRRGFDTLVQTSTGISTEVMRRAGLAAPRLLPAQVLDYATGYLMAAAAVRGLTTRIREGRGSTWRLALARTASSLVSGGTGPDGPELALPVASPVEPRVYTSPRGPVRRLAFPVTIAGAPLFWERPGDPYGSATPTWATDATAGR